MNKFDLGEEIAKLAVNLEAAEYQLIAKIGDFDASGVWAQQGAISCAHWLSWRIGLAPGAAREKVRVARALKSLPLISNNFEQGKLSYSKVRAMTRVASAENEGLLVDIARNAMASDLERICRRFRSVLQHEEHLTTKEADERRYVRVDQGTNGMVRMTIQLPADEGARLIAAIDNARLSQKQDVSAETPRRPNGAGGESMRRPNRADGVMIVAESFLADGPKSRRGGAPHEVHLHVTQSELESKTDGAFITNAGGTGVSAETARRLTCDAAIVRVVEDARGNVLDIGRRSRTVSAAIRRALNLRDSRKCSFPGCPHDLFLDAHHIEHWVDGGKTALSNLVLLCRRHHTFVHEHGYRIDLDASNRPIFRAPDGHAISSAPALPEAPTDAIRALAEQHASAGRELDDVALMPQHWNGDPIDLHLTVHALAIETLGDVPRLDWPRTRPVSELDMACGMGLTDEAYDTWAIAWESED